MESCLIIINQNAGTSKKIELSKYVQCPTCKGEGAKPGTTKKTCPKCGGRMAFTGEQEFWT